MPRVKRPVITKEYMEVLRPCLHFHGIQIKSEETFRLFAKAVNDIEAAVGIHECVISLEDIFVCPDIGIDEPEFETNTPMEKLLVNLIRRLKQGGKK